MGRSGVQIVKTWTPEFCHIFFTNTANSFSLISVKVSHPFPAKLVMDSLLVISLQGIAGPTKDLLHLFSLLLDL